MRCDSRPRSHSQLWSPSRRRLSGSAGAGGSARLTWAPPALSNPITIEVANANRRLFLDNGRDYRLKVVEPLRRELWIEGGRNVVVVGGHVTVDELGATSPYQDNTGVKVRFGDPAGTVHLEGLLIDGAHLSDGIAIATARDVQIQNVRVERAYDNVKTAHADCVQIQQGVADLRIDRFTCSTQRQGIFLGDNGGAIGSADLRRVNMLGAPGTHLLWQTTASFDVAVSDVWLGTAPDFRRRGLRSASGCIRSGTARRMSATSTAVVGPWSPVTGSGCGSSGRGSAVSSERAGRERATS